MLILVGKGVKRKTFAFQPNYKKNRFKKYTIGTSVMILLRKFIVILLLNDKMYLCDYIYIKKTLVSSSAFLAMQLVLFWSDLNRFNIWKSEIKWFTLHFVFQKPAENSA